MIYNKQNIDFYKWRDFYSLSITGWCWFTSVILLLLSVNALKSSISCPLVCFYACLNKLSNSGRDSLNYAHKDKCFAFHIYSMSSMQSPNADMSST